MTVSNRRDESRPQAEDCMDCVCGFPMGIAPRFLWVHGQASPVMMPLGEPSIYAAWRAQYLRRLASPVFSPLGEPSIYAAWRAQYLRCLAGPVLTPFGEAKNGKSTPYRLSETTISNSLYPKRITITQTAISQHRARFL